MSTSPAGARYLLLHRADGPAGGSGDWAWGQPSGCVEPGEDIAACAIRELYEETGIRGEPRPVVTKNIAWALFYVEVPWGTPVRLAPTEHNEFVWATFDQARQMCRPAPVAEGFILSARAALAAQ